MNNSSKPILFSAIQPSGNPTLGNYIGVLRHWLDIQTDYQCFYCIADLHSLTVHTDKKILKSTILDTIALYLACGVDPNQSIFFVQSHVPEHCQLSWILNCYSYFGELYRMTQFKKKMKDNIQHINSGILNYPILMASDILLYETNFVLIGTDQRQHLELSRNLAKRFNTLYGHIFQVPKILIYTDGAKIMSLLDPAKKMSKSDSKKNNVIFLLETLDSVANKIKYALTDSDIPPKIYYDVQKKPAISNLLNILSCLTNTSIIDLEKKFSGVMYSNFKNKLIRVVSDILYKIQTKFYYYRNNEIYLKNVVFQGAKKAKMKAKRTLKKVYDVLGLNLDE